MPKTRLDYGMIQNASDMNQAQAMLTEWLKESCAPDDPPYISDNIANYDHGGAIVQERLGMDYAAKRGHKFAWKIYVICDEYGRKVQPGDKVTRKIKRGARGYDGKIIDSRKINAAIMAGTYDTDFHDFREFEVDERGCIECDFEDATYFLNVHGLHGKSNRPLRNRDATSGEPVKTPDGQHLHVHYFRYKEVDKQQYAALPVLNEDPKSEYKPKRGRKSNDYSETVDNGV